ncbi:MAG: Spy/CpxP family protein refolding chaperone [Thermodesulfobacteriota bacterium]
MKRLTILPLLLVLFVSFSAQAAHHEGKRGNWWENEKITSKIDLTDDQKTQLNDIAAKYDPALTEARDDYKAKKTAYKDAKSNKATSSADVIKSFDVMWDSKYKMKRIKLDMKLEMRDVLTQEQIDQLKEMKQAKKDKMKKKYKKHKDQMKETTDQ